MAKPKWLSMISPTGKKTAKSSDIEVEIKALKQDMAAAEASLTGIEDSLREAQISALADENGQADVDTWETAKKQTLTKIEATRSVLNDLEKVLKDSLIQERIARQAAIDKELVSLEKQREEFREELFATCARASWLMLQVAGKSRVTCDASSSPLPAVGEYRQTFFAEPLRQMLEKSGTPLGKKIQSLKYERSVLRIAGRHQQ